MNVFESLDSLVASAVASSATRADIGLTGLAASGGLIVVAVVISLWRKLELERSLLWSAARALVQLLIADWIRYF